MKATHLILMLTLAYQPVNAQLAKTVVYKCTQGSSVLFQDKVCPEGFDLAELLEYEIRPNTQDTSLCGLTAQSGRRGLDTLLDATNQVMSDRRFDKVMILLEKLDAIETELSQAPIPTYQRQQQLLQTRALLQQQLARYKN